MEEKKYFRVCTLLSSIFMILLGVFLMFVTAILAIAFLGVFKGSDAGTLVYFIAGGWIIQLFIVSFGLALAGLTITMGAREIKFIRMKPRDYKKSTAKLVGHLIFDGIMCAISLFLIILFMDSGDIDFMAYIAVGVAFMYFVCFWLVLADRLVFAGKIRKGKISEDELNPKPQTLSTVTTIQTKESERSVETLEQDLTKLKELHDKGLLTDEEYALQRQNILEKHAK